MKEKASSEILCFPDKLLASEVPISQKGIGKQIIK